MKKIIGCLTLAGIAITSTIALAGSTTATFTVTASAASICAAQTENLAFGELMGSPSPHYGTANVKVVCTPGVAYTIALDNGSNFSSPDRQMKEASTENHVPYQIYTANTYTTIWDSTNTVSNTADGTIQNNYGYGRITSSQLPAPPHFGTYSDTITATVTYAD